MRKFRHGEKKIHYDNGPNALFPEEAKLAWDFGFIKAAPAQWAICGIALLLQALLNETRTGDRRSLLLLRGAALSHTLARSR